MKPKPQLTSPLPTLTPSPSSMTAADKSLNLLLENTITESWTILINKTIIVTGEEEGRKESLSSSQPYHHDDPNTVTINYTYPTICKPVTNVQESTSTLLAARSYAKANKTDLAWKVLRSLFIVQGQNGYIPKYRYAANKRTTDDSDLKESYYVQNSTIPSVRMFGQVPFHYSPCTGTTNSQHSTCYTSNGQYSYINELQIQSSGRLLSASPIHSTIILHIYYLSNQTMNDLNQLSFYFERLYSFHDYWMEEHLSKYCFDMGGGGTAIHRTLDDNGNKFVIDLSSCYNVIHPWESFIDIHSSSWKELLMNQIHDLQTTKWEPKDDMINDNFITNSIHYPKDDNVYEAMLFLTECHKNVTFNYYNKNDDSNRDDKEGYNDYEQDLISQCGFALLDVSNLAILSKSNHDLIEIGKILKSHHTSPSSPLYKPGQFQFDKMNQWKEIGMLLLDSLWNETEGRYLSRSMHFDRLLNDYGQFVKFVPSTTTSNNAKIIIDKSLGNLVVGWEKLHTSKFTSSVTSPLLNRESFNCGTYNIWSREGCGEDDAIQSSSSSYKPSIYPLLNYYISIGLSYNGALGISDFIHKATINLMCFTSSYITSNTTSSSPSLSFCKHPSFANTFDALSGQPMTHSTACDLSSTTSAAILYNLIVQDHFNIIKPMPPMNNKWIIFIIIIELIIVFSVGISCLLVSLNILRKLKIENRSSVGSGNNARGGGRERNSMMLEILRSQSESFLNNEEEYQRMDNDIIGDYNNSRGDGEEEGDELLSSWDNHVRFDEQEPFHRLVWNYIQSFIPSSSSSS